MNQPEPIPWARWLFAAIRLGVPPAAFWRLSLREWRALAEPLADDSLDQPAFQALAARYPDEKR